MNKIKRVLYSIVTTIAITPLFVYGGTLKTPVVSGFAVDDAEGLANDTVFQLIANFMNWLLGLVGVLGVLAFVISGVMYITSPGDQEQAEKAKSAMLYAIIGLVVAFVGLIVVNAISGLTGAGSFSCSFLGIPGTCSTPY